MVPRRLGGFLPYFRCLTAAVGFLVTAIGVTAQPSCIVNINNTGGSTVTYQVQVRFNSSLGDFNFYNAGSGGQLCGNTLTAGGTCAASWFGGNGDTYRILVGGVVVDTATVSS